MTDILILYVKLQLSYIISICIHTDNTKKNIDRIELKPEVWKLQSDIFPHISLSVSVSDDIHAAVYLTYI